MIDAYGYVLTGRGHERRASETAQGVGGSHAGSGNAAAGVLLSGPPLGGRVGDDRRLLGKLDMRCGGGRALGCHRWKGSEMDTGIDRLRLLGRSLLTYSDSHRTLSL